MRPFAYRILIVAAVVLGCSCGGNNNRGGGNPMPPVLCPMFAPTDPPASGTVTMVQGVNSDCNAVQVELEVTDVTDVFSVATTIEYDFRSLAFVGLTTDGSVLTQDGAQLNALAQELVVGQITLGVSRNAADGIDVTGTAKLVTLFFVPVDTGMGDLTIVTPCLTGSEQPPIPKAAVNCSGGITAVDEQ